jgi:2-isopropylmalate synthase
MLVIIHLCSLQGRQLGGILSSGKAGISIRHGGNHYVKQANERALAILNRVKQLESVGYTFEGAEASVHLMILHSARGYCPPFQVLDYSAHVYDSNMDSASRIMMNKENDKSSHPKNGSTARATVQVRTMRPQEEFDPFAYPKEEETLPYEDHLEVSDGSGPVDALANALKKALLPVHPYLNTVELVDYKVRILDPENATAASTRVMIVFRDTAEDTTWTTVSVDTNVISASLNAMIDGFEFALIEHASQCFLCEDAF